MSTANYQQETVFPPPLVEGNQTFHSVTEAVCRVVEAPPSKGWLASFAMALLGLAVLGVSVGWLIWEGTGIWGLNQPVSWGFAIVNFVFWVGIGHAGTLISAILFLFRQKWRTSINRFAEAMTIFAVICALLFPGIHVGRVWLLHWALPIPNQMGMWPNFRSPLLWDVFAVSTYFTVSLLFWYVGPHPRPGHPARPREEQGRLLRVRHVRPRVARREPALAELREGLPDSGRPLGAAGALGAHHRVLRLRRPRSSPAGTRRSSRPTSSPAPSSPASPWC
jgi:hypothetical protein